jgi:hypothetical protein
MTVAGISSDRSFTLPPLPHWLKTAPQKAINLIAENTVDPFKAIYALGVNEPERPNVANLPVLLNEASGVIPDIQQFLVTLAEKSVSLSKTLGGGQSTATHIGDSFQRNHTVPHLIAALGTMDADTISTDVIMALPVVKGGLKAWGLYQNLKQETALNPVQIVKVLSSHLFKL